MSLIASGGASSSNSGSSVTTGSADTTGAKLIVVHVADYAGETASTLTDSKGNTWTALTPVTTTNTRSSLFYVINPTAGSGHTFTATKVVGNTFPSIQFSAWAPDATYDQYVSHADGSNSFNQVGSLTPGANNGVFVTGLCLAATEASLSIDSGFTISTHNDYVVGQALGGAMGYFEQGTAAAKNPLWDFTSTESTATMATFLLSGGTGKPFLYYARMRNQ